MKTVRAYPLPQRWQGDEPVDIEMPAGAQLLTASVHHGVPYVHALVGGPAVETRRFCVASTDQSLHDHIWDYAYVGSFALTLVDMGSGGGGGPRTAPRETVHHIFEVSQPLTATARRARVET